MNKCIKCGSYAFNLHKDNIDQGGLCDVHYWQGRAHRAEAQPEQESVAMADYMNLMEKYVALLSAQPEQEQHARDAVTWTPETGYVFAPQPKEPEQEPVAFYVYKPTLPRGNLGNVSDGNLPWVYDQDPSSGYSARMLVYTAPPQRTWVGLTDEEINDIAKNYALNNPTTPLHFARAIEAKLRSKNG